MNLFSVNGAFVPKITLDEHGRRNRFTPTTTEETGGVVDNPVVASFLEVLNNLSDLSNAAAARNNLGLGTAAVLNSDGLFNAGSIKGVTIDDTAKADGKVLSFNAGTNRVVYISPPSSGGEEYDQSLNTTDDVEFNTITATINANGINMSNDLDMNGYDINVSGNITLNTSTEVLPSIYFRNDEDAVVSIRNVPTTPDLTINLDSGTGTLRVDGDLDLNGHSILNAVGGGGGGGFNVLEDGLHATDNVQMDNHNLYMESGAIYFGDIVEGKMNNIQQIGNGLQIASDNGVWIPTPQCQMQIESDEEGIFSVWGDSADFYTQLFFSGAATTLIGNCDSDGTNAVAIGFSNHVGFNEISASYTFDFNSMLINDGDTIILYDSNDNQFIFEFDNDSIYDSEAHIQVLLDVDPAQTATNFIDVINTNSVTYNMTAQTAGSGTATVYQSIAGPSGNTSIEGTVVNDSFSGGLAQSHDCFAFGSGLVQDPDALESNTMLIGFGSNNILIHDSGFVFNGTGFDVNLSEGQRANFTNGTINTSVVEFGPQSESVSNYIEQSNESLRLTSTNTIVLDGDVNVPNGHEINTGWDTGEGFSYGNIIAGAIEAHGTLSMQSTIEMGNNSISNAGAVDANQIQTPSIVGVAPSEGPTQLVINSGLLSFFNVTPVAQQATLSLNSGVVNSGDTGTDDAINAVITRVNEIETALTNLGLLAPGLPPA